MDQFNVALDYVSCNYTAMYGEVGGNGLIPDPEPLSYLFGLRMPFSCWKRRALWNSGHSCVGNCRGHVLELKQTEDAGTRKLRHFQHHAWLPGVGVLHPNMRGWATSNLKRIQRCPRRWEERNRTIIFCFALNGLKFQVASEDSSHHCCKLPSV